MASDDDTKTTATATRQDPGPTMGINRRDFINGMAISLASTTLLNSKTAMAMATEAASVSDLAVAADLGSMIAMQETSFLRLSIFHASLQQDLSHPACG